MSLPLLWLKGKAFGCPRCPGSILCVPPFLLDATTVPPDVAPRLGVVPEVRPGPSPLCRRPRVSTTQPRRPDLTLPILAGLPPPTRPSWASGPLPPLPRTSLRAPQPLSLPFRGSSDLCANEIPLQSRAPPIFSGTFRSSDPKRSSVPAQEVPSVPSSRSGVYLHRNRKVKNLDGPPLNSLLPSARSRDPSYLPPRPTSEPLSPDPSRPRTLRRSRAPSAGEAFETSSSSLTPVGWPDLTRLPLHCRSQARRPPPSRPRPRSSFPFLRSVPGRPGPLTKEDCLGQLSLC